MSFCKVCSATLFCYGEGCVCSNCGAGKEKNTPGSEAATAKKHKMPSVFKQAKNLAKSAYTHIANGAQKVPEKIYKSRLDVCEGCDKLSKGRCSECGCFVKMKASWGLEECPIGKWGRYEQTKGKCGGCGGK